MTKITDKFLLQIYPQWKDKEIQELLNQYNREHVKWNNLLNTNNKKITPTNLSNRKIKQAQKIRENIVSKCNEAFYSICILENLLNDEELRKE